MKISCPACNQVQEQRNLAPHIWKHHPGWREKNDLSAYILAFKTAAHRRSQTRESPSGQSAPRVVSIDRAEQPPEAAFKRKKAFGGPRVVKLDTHTVRKTGSNELEIWRATAEAEARDLEQQLQTDSDLARQREVLIEAMNDAVSTQPSVASRLAQLQSLIPNTVAKLYVKRNKAKSDTDDV